MPFTSRPHVKLGVGFAFTPEVPSVDSEGHQTFKKITALPPVDEFSLEVQLKSGVPLKQLDSRLLGGDVFSLPSSDKSVEKSVEKPVEKPAEKPSAEPVELIPTNT